MKQVKVPIREEGTKFFRSGAIITLESESPSVKEILRNPTIITAQIRKRSPK